jgi:predicted amidohydrolase YtcJ
MRPLALGLIVACVACSPSADFVIRGGRVFTADSAQPWARAVAVAGGRILYVGSDSGVERYIGRATRVHVLPGTLMLPGFHDAHVHPIGGGTSLEECDISGLNARAAVLARIKACARANPATPWVRGRGWELPVFPAANPRRELLDSLVPDRPAYFTAADGHSAWVNSRALAIGGVTAATADPPRGRIERDARGAPSGTLRESAARLVSSHLPAYTHDDRVRALRRALALANQYGITSLIDASVDSAALAAWLELERRGELTARVVAAIHVDPAGGAAQVRPLARLGRSYTGPLLRATAAKIYADGVLESKTAAVLEPYLGGPPDDRGRANLEPATFDSLVIALDREGFQVHVHAIGDRGVREALDAFEAARRANGPRDSRHQIAHLEMIDTADVPRFAALGVYANFQPLWAWNDSYIRDLTAPILGPERSSRLYPIGSVVRHGGTLVAGSDWPVSSLNPLEAIQVAVTRRAPDDTVAGPAWLPNEVVSLEEIVRAYTVNGARASFEERDTGTISAGKAADLIVLDRDLFAIRPQDIHRARVVLTLLEGRVVYRDTTAIR